MQNGDEASGEHDVDSHRVLMIVVPLQNQGDTGNLRSSPFQSAGLWSCLSEQCNHLWDGVFCDQRVRDGVLLAFGRDSVFHIVRPKPRFTQPQFAQVFRF